MQTFSVVQELSSLVQHHLNTVAVLEEVLPLASDPALHTMLSRHSRAHSDAVARLYDHLDALDMSPDITLRLGHEFRDTWQSLWSEGDDRAVLVALCMNAYLAMSYLQRLLDDPGLIPKAEDAYQQVFALEASHFVELTEYTRLLGGELTFTSPPDDDTPESDTE